MRMGLASATTVDKTIGRMLWCHVGGCNDSRSSR